MNNYEMRNLFFRFSLDLKGVTSLFYVSLQQNHYPERCPGLVCDALSGLTFNKNITRAGM